jgi:hypothetical protein
VSSIAPALAAWGGLSIPIEVIALAGAPGAHLMSWVTGWPLEREGAIACYLVGFAITPPMVLAPLGALVAALVPMAAPPAER